MRKLRQPNGTEEYVPKCDHCGEEIEIDWTGGGLNRWFHVGGQRWCAEKVVNGEARKKATHKGLDVPTGRYHRLPRTTDDPEVKASLKKRQEDVVTDLLAVSDEIDELRHRLRNDNGS